MCAMSGRVRALMPALSLLLGSVLSAQYFVPGPLIPELNPAGTSNFSPTVSTDELYMVFSSTRPGGAGGYDLYDTSRPAIGAPWSPPVNLAALNSISDDYEPNLSIDGLTLFFISTRAGGIGPSDIYVSTRPTTAAPWGPPANLGAPLNAVGIAHDDPYLTEDQLTLFFTATGVGGADVWSATRPAIGLPFGAAAVFAPASGTSFDHSPAVEGNGGVVFFSSTRPGGTTGSSDFYMVTLDPVTSTYSAPVGIAGLNTIDWDSNMSIGRTTGTVFVSQFVGANSSIVQVFNTDPPVTIPTSPTIATEPHAIAAPARTVWRRSYSSSITVPTVTLREWRPAASGAAGRIDALLVSFFLQTPSLPASLVFPGSTGDIFLAGSVVTLTLTIVPPATVAGVQSATLAVPPVPAFAGLVLHLQGADLDIAPSLLQMSQPASLLLTP
jgi:hypothetical protein